MVVDNADDDSVLFDALRETSSADRLIDWLPHSRKGSIVFTTRTREAAIKLAASNVVPLGELTETEAEEVMKSRLLQEHQHQLHDSRIINEFLDMLAFLALAIVQAVAYINAKGVTIAKYISLFKNSEKDATELLSKEFEDYGRYPKSKNPVGTTWYISFEQVRRHGELAARYLSFMACMASSDIPASLLPPASSDLAQTEAIGTLKAYAFIIERQAQKMGGGVNQMQTLLLEAFDVHPLVHRATRGWLKAQNQWHVWANMALTRLVQVVPYGDHDRKEVWTAYLPHAMHVADLPELYEAEARMSLLDRTGRCEQTLGRFRGAELVHRKLLEQRTDLFGKGHSSTQMSMNEVAVALSDQGKYAEAEQMHRETLVLREDALGKEHTDTLMSMSDLALALSRQGKYAEAEKMHQETLALREKVLGKEHPYTLISMNDLALALSGQGKYAEAEQMHREELALREEVSGKEHPHTLMSISNLALALSGQGKYAEAEQMHRETLALREEILGKEHLDTILNVYRLAYLLQCQHQYCVALPLYKQAYTGYQATLGPDHTTTRECLEHYTSVQLLVDKQTSGNKRSDLAEAISNPAFLDHQSPNIAELTLRPKDRLRRKLKKWKLGK